MEVLQADGLSGVIPEFLEAFGVPSISLAVVRAGEIDTCAAVGSIDATGGKSVNTNTVYEAASLTKPVFAFLVHRLANAGRVDLDEPLATSITHELFDRDRRSQLITPRHILTHTTGLPNWRRHTGQLKTYFEPGSRFSYSGEGFVLLQRLVEQIFGEDLEAIMRAEIFDPLEMRASTLVWRQAQNSDVAIPHKSDGQPFDKKLQQEAIAAGSLHTTAQDLALFMCQLIRDRRVNRPMLEPALGISGSRSTDVDWPDMSAPLHPGIRWANGIATECSGDDTNFWQWGDNIGWKAFFVGCVDHGNGAVMLTNSDNGSRVYESVLAHMSPESHPALDSLHKDLS